ncbi:MAG: hypothetical protein ACOZAM_29095 [Pseudomonadota bacterium]
MPLKRETARPLDEMAHWLDERSTHMRAIRRAGIRAEQESLVRIAASRKLLAETAHAAKGYMPRRP